MKSLVEDIGGAALTGLLIFGSSVIDVSDPVVYGAIVAGLAALTGAIKVLWDRNNKLSATTDVALSKCEEEHTKASAKYDSDRKQSAEQMNVLIQQVIKLSGEVGLLTGRIQGFQEATDKADASAHAHAHNDEKNKA